MRLPLRDVSIVSLALPARDDYSVSSRCWRWKSAVMGDDLGLPRRRAARSLGDLVASRDGIHECSILSTCARLDFLIVADSSQQAFDAAADVLGRQVAGEWEGGLMAWLDRAEISANDDNEPLDVSDALEPHFGLRAAAEHLCLVATGVEEGFDPFCSRRAHVVHQIKSVRTEGGSLRALVDAAIAAGKSARNSTHPLNKLVKTHPGDAGVVRKAEQRARRVANDTAQNLCEEELIVKPLLTRFMKDGKVNNVPSDRLHQATIDIRKRPLYYRNNETRYLQLRERVFGGSSMT